LLDGSFEKKLKRQDIQKIEATRYSSGNHGVDTSATCGGRPVFMGVNFS
jgi:hypothetical protein